jgi:hypothetical protein
MSNTSNGASDFSWRELIDEERERHDDGPIISCTLSDAELDVEFDCGTAEQKANHSRPGRRNVCISRSVTTAPRMLVLRRGTRAEKRWSTRGANG